MPLTSYDIADAIDETTTPMILDIMEHTTHEMKVRYPKSLVPLAFTLFFLGQNEELLRQKDEIESVIAECSVSEEEKDAMRGELELLLSFLEYNRIDATAGRLSCWAVRPHSSTAKAHGHSVLPRCCICTGGKAEILTKK